MQLLIVQWHISRTEGVPVRRWQCTSSVNGVTRSGWRTSKWRRLPPSTLPSELGLPVSGKEGRALTVVRHWASNATIEWGGHLNRQDVLETARGHDAG